MSVIWVESGSELGLCDHLGSEKLGGLLVGKRVPIAYGVPVCLNGVKYSLWAEAVCSGYA